MAQLLKTPEAVPTATAAGEESTELAFGESGTLHHVDASSGKVTDQSKPIGKVDTSTPPSLEIDTTRGFISDAAEHEIHEIDDKGDLNTARISKTSGEPDMIVETGP